MGFSATSSFRRKAFKRTRSAGESKPLRCSRSEIRSAALLEGVATKIRLEVTCENTCSTHSTNVIVFPVPDTGHDTSSYKTNFAKNSVHEKTRCTFLGTGTWGSEDDVGCGSALSVKHPNDCCFLSAVQHLIEEREGLRRFHW